MAIRCCLLRFLHARFVCRYPQSSFCWQVGPWFIHRFSSRPDSHAVRTKRLFARYGTKVLVISKFVIGLDAIAPPLAGMSGTGPLRFASLDAVGAALWAGLYAGLGYVFCKQLDRGAAYAERMGAIL